MLQPGHQKRSFSLFCSITRTGPRLFSNPVPIDLHDMSAVIISFLGQSILFRDVALRLANNGSLRVIRPLVHEKGIYQATVLLIGCCAKE